MRRARYQSGMAELVYRRNLWMAVALLMALANGVEAWWLVTRTSAERHHLVPLGAGDPGFRFSGNQYTHEYWERMGTWFAGLALTYTPDTFDYQATTFLRYAHPEAYGALKAVLVAEKKVVDERGQSQVFYVRGVRVRGMNVAVKGILATRIGNREVDRRAVTWLAGFASLPGGPVAVTRFKEVDSDDPFAGIDA